MAKGKNQVGASLTVAQRQAVKAALLSLKRFWNGQHGTDDEDTLVENFIDSLISLATELESL